MHWLLRKLTFILVITTSVVYGQNTSQLNRFSIPYEKGCAPVEIHITTSSSFSGFTNSYYYEGGSIDSNDTFHIYTNPGIYTIVQLTQETITPKTDTLTFEVLPPDPPQFNIYECGTQTVLVDITDGDYDYYRVYFSNNDSIDYQAGDPSPTHTYASNNVNILVKGFYLNGYANCGELFRSVNLINVLPVASINNANLTPVCGTLFNATISSATEETIKYQVELSYNSGPFDVIYEGPIINDLLTVPDITNDGNTDFCLRINTVDPCSNNIQNGPAYCNSLSNSLFSYLSDAYASYSGDHIAINFTAQAFQKVIVKKEGSGTFNLLDTISGPDIFSSSGTVNNYRLLLIDTCANILDSADVAPPHLNISDRDFETNTINIELIDGTNPLTKISKELVLYSEDSSVVEVINFADQFKLSPNIGSVQRIRARIWYSEISVPIYSNEVLARYVYRIYVPTAFTPNHDGLNDRLQFFGIVSDKVEITIYNRWGQKIHFTDNLSTGWNGYVNNELAPEGAYTYEIKFMSPDGKEIQQVGTFALINK